MYALIRAQRTRRSSWSWVGPSSSTFVPHRRRTAPRRAHLRGAVSTPATKQHEECNPSLGLFHHRKNKTDFLAYS